MRRIGWLAGFVVAACGGSSGDDGATVDARPDGGVPVVGCAPLAPAAGNVVTVTPAQAAQLPAIDLDGQPHSRGPPDIGADER